MRHSPFVFLVVGWGAATLAAQQTTTLPKPRFDQFYPFDTRLEWGFHQLEGFGEAFSLSPLYQLSTPLAPVEPLFTEWSLSPLSELGIHTLELRSWSHPLRLAEPPFNTRQGTPEDSLYRQARTALNQGEYRKASDLFRTFEQRFGKSKYVPASMYWQAFSLYRVGTDEELRRALKVLDEQRQRYPDAAGESEVSALLTRVAGALAARGDHEAASRLRQNVAQGKRSCDEEDMEVRAEALSALVQADPVGAQSVLDRTLSRREECYVALRRRAVYLLGRDGVSGGVERLVEVAKGDPEAQVRNDAVGRLGQLRTDAAIKALEQLMTGADESTRRSVIQSLRHSESPEAARIIRRLVERDDLNENDRAEAIRSLMRRNCCGVATTLALTPAAAATPTAHQETTLAENDAAYLRTLYEKTTSRVVKGAILETLTFAGGPGSYDWLMAVIRNPNEDSHNRRAALSRLGREVRIDEVVKLYDAMSERQLRGAVIEILGVREEPAASDKLVVIAKTGTDPELRRYAIGALSRKKDPRTTKLLLDLVEK